jgi:hypothetical protein
LWLAVAIASGAESGCALSIVQRNLIDPLRMTLEDQ